MLEECMKEMRVSSQHVMVTLTNSRGVGRIMDCTNFSTLAKLLQAYLIRFCRILKAKIQQQDFKTQATLGASEIQAAETLWIKEAQSCLRTDDTFKKWEHQFGLFLKEECGNAKVDWGMQMFLMLPGTLHY